MSKFKTHYLMAAGFVILILVAANAGQMTSPTSKQPKSAADWALNATIRGL